MIFESKLNKCKLSEIFPFPRLCFIIFVCIIFRIISAVVTVFTGINSLLLLRSHAVLVVFFYRISDLMFFSSFREQPNQSQKFSSLFQSASVCQYCCQWQKPDDVRVRLRPKRRPSAVVRSVLLRQARGKRLSVLQKKLLFRFQKSSSVLVRTKNTTNHS